MLEIRDISNSYIVYEYEAMTYICILLLHESKAKLRRVLITRISFMQMHVGYIPNYYNNQCFLCG